MSPGATAFSQIRSLELFWGVQRIVIQVNATERTDFRGFNIGLSIFRI